MDCPRCSTALAAMKTAAGPTVDFCASCGGTWFDEGEFEALLGLKDPLDIVGHGAAGSTGIPCPCCSAEMAELTYRPPGTELCIDTCTHCHGLWLDRGEPGQLKNLVRRSDVAFVTVQPVSGGPPVEVPIKLRRPRKGLDWRWVGYGTVIMFVTLAAFSGFPQAVEAFDLISDKDTSSSVGRAIAWAALSGFPIGGFVIGLGSAGFTVWEAAIASVPAAILFLLLFGNPLGHGVAAGLVVGGFVLSLIGAVAGERKQAG